MCNNLTRIGSAELAPSALLTTRQLAHRWRYSPDKVTALVRDSAWLSADLPRPIWIGPDSNLGPYVGQIRFPRESVENFLDHRSAAGKVPIARVPGDVRLELLTTRELAASFAVPYDTMKKWCASRIWEHGGLPSPIYIGRNSHLTAHITSGSRLGDRRWRSTAVTAWIDNRLAADALTGTF